MKKECAAAEGQMFGQKVGVIPKVALDFLIRLEFSSRVIESSFMFSAHSDAFLEMFGVISK